MSLTQFIAFLDKISFQVDKLAGLAQKVNSVKLVMQDNVDAALQNTVKLDHIERQAGTVAIVFTVSSVSKPCFVASMNCLCA